MLKKTVTGISKTLSSCVMPVIPLIIAGSILKLIYLLMGFAHLDATTSGRIVELTGDLPFYFMPVLVSFYAAKYFRTDPLYAAGAALVLVAPGFVTLMTGDAPVTFAGLPVIRNNYPYQILPVILTVFALSKIEPFLAKHFPKVLKGVLYSFVVFSLIVLLEILVLAPAGYYLGAGLSYAFEFCLTYAAVPTWGVFTALTALMIPAGMQWFFVTNVFNDLARTGHDNGTMAAFLIMGMAVAGADIAYAVRSKTSHDRAAYASYGIALLFTGVSEPSLFSLALRDRRALRAILLACFIPGMYQGLHSIPCYIYSFPAIPSILMFYSADNPGNVQRAALMIAVSFVLGFLLTFLFCRHPLPAPDEDAQG